MKERKFNRSSKLANLTLAFIVIISMLGLLGFAFIDENSRIIFLDVAKMSIAAYLGYLVPNAR